MLTNTGFQCEITLFKGNLQTDTFVVVDIEATGLDLEKDELIEIAALRIKAGKPTASWHALVCSKKPIPKDIQALTGITPAEVLQFGLSPKEALQAFLDFVGHDLLMGHQIQTDVAFLRRAIQETLGEPFEPNTFDTLRYAQFILPHLPRHELDRVARWFDLDCSGQHRAMVDVQLTYQIYCQLKRAADRQYELGRQWAKHGGEAVGQQHVGQVWFCPFPLEQMPAYAWSGYLSAVGSHLTDTWHSDCTGVLVQDANREAFMYPKNHANVWLKWAPDWQKDVLEQYQSGNLCLQTESAWSDLMPPVVWPDMDTSALRELVSGKRVCLTGHFTFLRKSVLQNWIVQHGGCLIEKRDEEIQIFIAGKVGLNNRKWKKFRCFQTKNRPIQLVDEAALYRLFGWSWLNASAVPFQFDKENLLVR